MPVVIKELVITLKANEAAERRQMDVERPTDQVKASGRLRRKLVEEAVAQAVAIINAKTER